METILTRTETINGDSVTFKASKSKNAWQQTSKNSPPSAIMLEGKFGKENLPFYLGANREKYFSQWHEEIKPPKKWRFKFS